MIVFPQIDFFRPQAEGQFTAAVDLNHTRTVTFAGQQIGLADKPGNELGARVFVEGGGASIWVMRPACITTTRSLMDSASDWS